MAGQFKAAETANWETIKARLDERETQLVKLHRLAPGASLKIELGQGTPEDHEIVREHKEVEERVRHLRLALEAAEVAENLRRNARIVQDDASRRRALAQHLSKLAASMDKVFSAVQAAAANFADACDAARSAAASQPADMRREDIISYALNPRRLGYLFTIEVARAAEERGTECPLSKIPFIEGFRRSNGSLPPMRDVLADQLNAVKNQLREGQARVAARYGTTAGSPAAVMGEPVSSPPAGSPQPSKIKVA